MGLGGVSGGIKVVEGELVVVVKVVEGNELGGMGLVGEGVGELGKREEKRVWVIGGWDFIIGWGDMVIGMWVCWEIGGGKGFGKIMVRGVIVGEVGEEMEVMGIEGENGKGMFRGREGDRFVYILEWVWVVWDFGIDSGEMGI